VVDRLRALLEVNADLGFFVGDDDLVGVTAEFGKNRTLRLSTAA
jgi:hypothetical protein